MTIEYGLLFNFLPKDFLPVLYGNVRVDALVAEVVDVGAQVFPRLLHVVEGGREVCLEDAHTLLHTNDSHPSQPDTDPGISEQKAN
jgi:hypothetical protein